MSHNSFAQLAAARTASIPARSTRWTTSTSRRTTCPFGSRRGCCCPRPWSRRECAVPAPATPVRRPPGLRRPKEELDLGGFRPDSGVEREARYRARRRESRRSSSRGHPRPGPCITGFDNPLFRQILEGATQQGGVHLRRLDPPPEQREEIARSDLPGAGAARARHRLMLVDVRSRPRRRRRRDHDPGRQARRASGPCRCSPGPTAAVSPLAALPGGSLRGSNPSMTSCRWSRATANQPIRRLAAWGERLVGRVREGRADASPDQGIGALRPAEVDGRQRRRRGRIGVEGPRRLGQRAGVARS